MILDTIREGKIVPSAVTVKLILRELASGDNHKFLIDGFPRSEENRVAFERIVSLNFKLLLIPISANLKGIFSIKKLSLKFELKEVMFFSFAPPSF